MTPEESQRWFYDDEARFAKSYLAATEPWRQSGMSGPEDRWTSLRKPVADCMDRDGSFLDIGCANGYLIECCLKWTAERGIRIDAYGVDIYAPLVDLARKRLPQIADHFFVANAFEWTPPLRFDFVRTELVYVPDAYERPYVEHLLEYYLNPGGRLLVANYVEDHPTPEIGLSPGSHVTKHILDRLGELGFEAVGYEDGYDPVKRRKVRIAMLTA